MPRTNSDPATKLTKRAFLHALTAVGIGGVVAPSAWRSALSLPVAQESGRVNLLYCWRRLPTMSREEAQKYWLETHAPLVRTAATAMNIRRYAQLHSLDDSTSTRLRAARQSLEPFDGAAEISWNSFGDFAPTVLSPERLAAGARLLEDEKKFIDFTRSVIWVTRERVIVG